MSSAEYESVGWAVIESNGTIDAQTSEGAARAEASRLVSFNHECEAVELFRLRKPVPERPRIRLTGYLTVGHEVGCYVATRVEPHHGARSVYQNAHALFRSIPPASPDELRALLDLPAATAAWEAEFGGEK